MMRKKDISRKLTNYQISSKNPSSSNIIASDDL